jgi:hypothetical protein
LEALPFSQKSLVFTQNRRFQPCFAMRPAYWNVNDPEMRWGNPNLRWGSPSYILEPGDPGYVPPANPVSQTKPKAKKMKHNTYYPTKLADQILWLVNFNAKLASHATALGLTTAQVTAILADCAWLIYVLQSWLTAVRNWAQSCTDAANLAQTGTGGVQTLPVFVPPAVPTGTAPVTLGALTRIFALVQQIKTGGKCTDDIATDLGIVGSVATPPDMSTMQPVITAKVNGSHVDLGWGWQGNSAYLDACEILVDRADGKGFVALVVDTTPNYTDTQAFPVAKAIWTYKAIYRVGDGQVGQWSQPVSVTVGG